MWQNHTSVRPKNEKNDCEGFIWESMVHDLCGIEVYISFFRNRILISIASQLCTRVEFEILVPKHASASIFLFSGCK